MIRHWVGLLLGLALVCKGGDLFVDASVQISTRLKIPRIIVGGTIVSLATTLPELMVSVTASLMKNSGIAVGNAVGSVIANIGLILGVSALFSQLTVEPRDFRRRSIWLGLASLFLIFFTWKLHLARISAAAFFIMAAAYLYFDYQNIKTHRSQSVSNLVTAVAPHYALKKSAIIFFIGAALVLIGSKILVESAVSLAEALGISSAIIGLSIVAVGTSLPELVTAVTAFKKGVHDLSIGNIIGASVLNLTLIIGVSGMIHPLDLTLFLQWYSLPWLCVFVFLTILLFRKGTLGRAGGILFLVLYGFYLTGLVLSSMRG